MYICELMLWLGKFVNVKWVKIPSLAVLQVAKYTKQWSNVREPLKNRTYLEKKCFLIFWAPILSCPKAITGVKKKPVLGPILHTRRESDVHKTFRRRTSKCLIRIQSKNWIQSSPIKYSLNSMFARSW